MSGAKAALKAAKEQMTSGDFKSALKSCNKAINADRDNYLAIVMAGKCQDNIGDKPAAEKMYNAAISKDPEQIPAWQGKIKLYEQMVNGAGGESKVDHLSECYEKMCKHHLETESDLTKYLAVSDKHWKLWERAGRLKKATSVLGEQSARCREKGDARREAEAVTALVRMLSQTKEELDANLQATLRKALECSVVSEGDQSVQNLDNFKALIKLLYKLRDMRDLLEVSVRMHGVFPDSSYPLEWICKVYLEYVTDTLDFTSTDLDERALQYVDRLLEKSPNSTLGKLSKGAIKWKESDFAGARDILKQVVGGNENPNFYGSYVLCFCHDQLKEFSECEAQVGITSNILEVKVKEEYTRRAMAIRLKALLVKTLYLQSSEAKMTKALRTMEAKPKLEGDEHTLLLAKIWAATGKTEEAERAMKSLKSELVSETEFRLVSAMLAKSRGDLQSAISLADKCLELEQDNFEALVLRGRIEFEKEAISDTQTETTALPYFLKAAKLNSDNPVPFLFLGHLYRDRGDVAKARKCYQKSFQLDPGSMEAGCSLSDIFRSQDAIEANMLLLKSVTSGSASSSVATRWAHLRLGMLYLSADDPTNAILCLQSAIRSDPTDVHAWGGLADAYRARGSYTAAMKAYDKVLRLNPDSVYAELQIGNLKLKLGHNTDAIAHFRKLLEMEPDYVPALKGLAEALLSEARDFLDDHIDANVIDNCQVALEALTKAAEARPEVTCLWRLMGDALTVVEQLADEIVVPFKVPKKLHKSASLTSKSDVLKLGVACYAKAARLQPENAGVWHNLACNYHAQAENTPDGVAAEDLRHKALSAMKRALSLEPKSHLHWNAMGVLAFRTGEAYFGLAQHAFIKSVEQENNSEAWTNLGILYLVMGESELANAAFKEAQNQDPSYQRGWVGQSLLAEVTEGFEDEAMDLLRHATFLGNEVESSAGYAKWVCRTLADPGSAKPHSRYILSHMHGVTVAVDCLTRYNQRIRGDAAALNMFGVLLEREGLLRGAKKALETSLANLNPANESELCTKVRLNLGRVSLKLFSFAAAIEHYAAVAPQTFESLCGFAVANYKEGNYQESYGAYQKALGEAWETGDKSHVLTAMASIAYKFQGAEAAKTLLFQSCQLSPPSVRGIYALCVLGIKHVSADLIEAALHEMASFADDPAYLGDVAWLRAVVTGLFGRRKSEARRELARLLHTRPDRAALWRAVGKYLVLEATEGDKVDATFLPAAAWVSDKATCMKRSQLGDDEDSGSGDEYDNLAAFSLLVGGNAKAAARAAAKSVHVRPEATSRWAVLVATAASEKKERNQRLQWLVESARRLQDGSEVKVKEWVDRVAQAVVL